jgi:hypothetical protein
MLLRRAGWILIASILALPAVVHAYETPTHAYLTQEISDFYNKNFSKQLSRGDQQFLIDGSVREDDTPRYMNHFYDPVYQRGLTSDNAIDPLYRARAFGTSKDWAQNKSRQTGTSYTGIRHIAALLGPLNEGVNTNGTDFTWQAGIRAYARGDRTQAMFVLGHTLHLIEDLTVPEHTRNEPHGLGSPYEEWALKFTPTNSDPNLKVRLKAPIALPDLNLYFDQIATYTNGNFYSPKTIGIQSGYQKPTSEYLKKEGSKYFRIGLDENSVEYRLVKQLKEDRFSYIVTNEDDFTLEDDLVLQDYWNHLAPKAIEYGAGVVQLFLKEGEAAKQDQSFIKDEPKSLIGQIIDAFQNVAASIFGSGDTSSPHQPSPLNDAPILPSSSPATSAPSKPPEIFSLPIPSPTVSTTARGVQMPISKVPSTVVQPPNNLTFNGGPSTIVIESTLEGSESVASSSELGVISVVSTTTVERLILAFRAELASSTTRFSWEISTSSATSTLTDITTTQLILFSGSETFFDATATADGIEHIFKLESIAANGISDSATTSVVMPAPPPLPPPPGLNNFEWHLNAENHGIDFTATPVSPLESGQVRMDISFQLAVNDLGGGANYVSGMVDSGEPVTLNIPALDNGNYHWRARLVYQAPNVGLRSFDWTPIDEELVVISPSTPRASGTFTEENFGELCGSRRTAFNPAEDFTPASVEFYAGCANGSCTQANAFQIYDIGGTLLAESEGSAAAFGYPAVSHIWQNFTGVNRVLLYAGETYYATPISHNGQCFVNPTDPGKNMFFIRD